MRLEWKGLQRTRSATAVNRVLGKSPRRLPPWTEHDRIQDLPSKHLPGSTPAVSVLTPASRGGHKYPLTRQEN